MKEKKNKAKHAHDIYTRRKIQAKKKGHVTYIRKKRTLSERQREVLVHAIFFKYS
jgi:hypothetical protein